MNPLISTLLLPLALVSGPDITDVQQLKLRDMPWGAKVSQVRPPFGFRFYHTERPSSYAWQGKIGNDEAVIVYAFTPLTTRLSEVTLILGSESKFTEARARYFKYRNLVTKTYGRATQTYEFFPMAYLKVPSGEDRALADGKYVLSNFWAKFTNTFIGMSITPEGWTCVTFESNQLRQAVSEESQIILQ